MHTFGASAPLKELQRHFGFEPDSVVALAKEMLGKGQEGQPSPKAAA
jgi:transketolase